MDIYYCKAFYKHWILFPTVWHIPQLSQGHTQGRPKCAKNVLKWRTIKLKAWITGKRLKIDGYILRRVWQTLNSLSIHVTFTAIVSGAYPGEAKMCKNVLKWRTFELSGSITGKRLKIGGYMLQGVWQALNSLSIHVTINYRDCGQVARQRLVETGTGFQRSIVREAIEQWRNRFRRSRGTSLRILSIRSDLPDSCIVTVSFHFIQ